MGANIDSDFDTFEIYVIDGDGNTTQLTENDVFDGYPAWSPNGQQIAFTSVRDGNWEIYVMDADGSNPVRITHTPDIDEILPTWSPNGKRFAVPIAGPMADIQQGKNTFEWMYHNAE